MLFDVGETTASAVELISASFLVVDEAYVVVLLRVIFDKAVIFFLWPLVSLSYDPWLIYSLLCFCWLENGISPEPDLAVLQEAGWIAVEITPIGVEILGLGFVASM